MPSLSAAKKIIALTLVLILFCLSGGWLLYQQNYDSLKSQHLQQLDYQESQLRDSLFYESLKMQRLLLQLKLLLLESGDLSAGSEPQRDRVEEVFRQLLRGSDALASQVRWLDAEGQERMRVNRFQEAGGWQLRSAEYLQDKSARPYYLQALKLKADRIYVSDLDLNIEQGRIQRPLEPTIRLAMATTARDHMTSGVLIINFNLAPLFEQLRSQLGTSADLQLVDEEGYWLFHNLLPGLAWRQLNPRNHLANWDKISSRQLALVLQSGGGEAMRMGDNYQRIQKLQLFQGLAGSHPWATISALTPRLLNDMALQALHRVLPVYLLMLAVVSTLLVLLCRAEASQARLQHQLREQLEELRRVSRFKTDFLANMSDDINSPISSLIKKIDLLWQTDLASSQRRCLSEIRKHSSAVSQVVADILDLSRMEDGKLVLQPRSFSLVKLLEECLFGQRALADSRNLNLHLQLGPDIDDRFFGDRQRLSQIINNLLENAVRHTVRGYVVLAVDQISEGREYNTLRFSVIDTGTGLDQQQVERLRADVKNLQPSWQRSEGDIGLGLVICNLLLPLMGSRLQVDSAPGEGCCFSFELAMEKRQSGSTHSPLELRPLTGGRVLVVGVDEMVQISLRQIFTHWRIRAHFISQYRPALDLLENSAQDSEDCHCVLLDYRCIRDQGIESVDELQKRVSAGSKRAPLIVVMAPEGEIDNYRNSEFQRRAIRTLVMPVTPTPLAEALSAAAGSESPRDLAHYEQEPFQLSPSPGTRYQYRVLLAEDNQTDQIVAREILERFGIEVEVVDNGARAVEILRREPFDLVFMDLQMPIMDGVQATRLIREFRPVGQLPILALTAATRQEDLQAAESAGMDGCLNKPINVNLLRKTLLRFLSGAQKVGFQFSVSREQARMTAQSGTSAAPLARFLNDDQFDLQQSILSTLGEKLYLQAVAAFCADMEPNLQQWNASADDWTRARKASVAHQLKGCAGGIGALDLEREAKLADLALKQDEAYDFGRLMRLLDRVLQTARASRSAA